MLISVGWEPPTGCPSGRLLRPRDEGGGPITAPRVRRIPGPRLRADGRARGWERLQAELQMPADLGRIPIGPRPFHQCPPGVAIPRLRDAAWMAPRSRRGLRGGQPERAHPLARGDETP